MSKKHRRTVGEVIDETALAEELTALAGMFLDMRQSYPRVWVLAVAAKATAGRADCPEWCRAVLNDYVGWVKEHAEFGSEMRKLLDLPANEPVLTVDRHGEAG